MTIKLNTLIPEFPPLQATSETKITPSSLKGQFFSSVFFIRKTAHRVAPPRAKISRGFTASIYCIKLPNFWCLSGLTKKSRKLQS